MVAWNRTRPRARTWVLEDLDRQVHYELYFDPDAFRWEVRAPGEPPVVTRIHTNRRSFWEGDRAEPANPLDRAGAARADGAEPGAPRGRRPPAG